MCGYFCTAFIDFMLKVKSLLDYTNLFSPNDYEKNVKIFSITKNLKNVYYVTCGKYRKFEKPKTLYLLEKTLVLSIICRKCKNEEEKCLKKKNQLRY